VLATVKHATRRLRRWPAAMLDRDCARRLCNLRPGRRNGPLQPNKETLLQEDKPHCKLGRRNRKKDIAISGRPHKTVW
jgi:hypothetical protein